MARAKMYGWSPKRFDAPKKIAEMKGQAALVRDTLDSMTNAAEDAGTEKFFLAESVTAAVNETGKLITRQDPARVVLYYLLVFKSKGFVAAVEQPTEETPDSDTVEQLDEVTE